MVSFTSSAVNKSGKKFAPKAPPRRAATAPKNVVNAATTGVDNRRPSITPGPETQKAHAPPVTSDADAQPSAVNAQQAQHTKESQVASADNNNAVALELPPSVSSATTATNREQSLDHQDVPPAGPTIAQSKSTELSHALDQLKGNDSPEATTRATRPTTIPGDLSRNIQSEKPTPIPRPSPKTIQQPTTTAINARPKDNLTGVNTNDDRNGLDAAGDPIASASQEFHKPALPQNKRRRSNTETSNATSDEVSRSRKPRAKRKREPTPEESEQIEIAPEVVRMSELCKDLRTGKKSKREVELRSLELAEAERKQKAREKNRQSSTPVKPDVENANGGSPTTPSKPQTGPQMRIVNGEIVIDNASLQLDQRAEAARELGEMEDVVENRLNRKVNQATYGKRTKAESWDDELTDLFYRGLRMFGTDFSLISNMFPGRSRRQIKLKFNNEERRDPDRIKRTLLGPRESIDIQTYSELTNTVYEDIDVIQKELEEDKRRIEEQHAKERLAQDEQIRNPGGVSNDTNIVPSIESVSLKKRNSTSKSR